MELSQLGALLREERERRGLSLDEVSDITKISRSCLAAIEAGNESGLPHPVYAKGFIKNYAKLLGLANEEFLENLSQLYHIEEEPVHHVPLIRDVGEDETVSNQGLLGRKRPLPRWVLSVVVLAVVLGAAWFGYTKFLAGRAEQAKTTPAATTEPEATSPAPETSAPQGEAASPSGSTPPAAPVPTVPPAAPSATEPKAPEAPAPATSASTAAPAPTSETAQPPTAEDRATQAIAVSGQNAAQPETTTPPAPQGRQFSVGEQGEHVVVVTSKGRCWLQAGADGGVMHESMLHAGDTFTGKFNKYLLMRLGNAGAVEIQFDGKVYPVHAGRRSVKTLRFIGRKSEAPAPEKSGDQKPAATPDKNAATPDGPAAKADKAIGAADTPAATNATTTAAAGTPNAAAAKELEVYGQDGSWVILMPDTGPPKEIYVKKGQRIKVPFGEKIEVKLGNPSSVVFRYDGKETPVTTERGEIKTVRFP